MTLFNIGFGYFCFGQAVRDGKCVRDIVWASIWCEEVPHDGNIHAKVMDCASPMLFLATTLLRFRLSAAETHRTTR